MLVRGVIFAKYGVEIIENNSKNGIKKTRGNGRFGYADGLWHMGNKRLDVGGAEEKEAIEAIHAAVTAGITTIAKRFTDWKD